MSDIKPEALVLAEAFVAGAKHAPASTKFDGHALTLLLARDVIAQHDAQRNELAKRTAERDEARRERNKLEAIKHAEETPIRRELRLVRAERDEWLADIRKILGVVFKRYEPTPDVVDEMGWCCYCMKKQNERNECGCLP